MGDTIKVFTSNLNTSTVYDVFNDKSILGY